jgi:hypothetical protein
MLWRVPGLTFLIFMMAVMPAAASPEAWKAEGWNRTDFSRTSVPWSDILSGGPPKDGIPAIDDPKFEAVPSIADLAPHEPVIGLDVGGDARAYPLRVLIWHEIVNDTVGGKPVTVTYCPLCNSAVVFERSVNGQVLDFGTTGKLRHSDLVMYDRQTESWWQQFTGEAIVGEMLGRVLKLVPARLESFADFKSRHPQGKVLVPGNPGLRDYGRNPYAGYDSSIKPFLYAGDLPEGIDPMARVVVAKPPSRPPVIVALTHLRDKGILTIGSLAFSWRAGQASAVDATDIAHGRDVGTVEVHDTADPAGPRLIPYDVTFAFAAHAFHPDITILQE